MRRGIFKFRKYLRSKGEVEQYGQEKEPPCLQKKNVGWENSKKLYKTVFLVATNTLQNISLIMAGEICHDRKF